MDQTNVYPSARRRKMKNFKGFIRRAAVMVPDDPELKRRSDKRTFEDGEHFDWISKHFYFALTLSPLEVNFEDR